MEWMDMGLEYLPMAYLSGSNLLVSVNWHHQFYFKKKRMINIKFVATEQPPKSPKQFASILRTSLQQCLHHRHNRILVDVEDSVSLDVEKSNARDKTKRELARLLIEMFYGTHIPVKVAFCNTKELQVAQTTWGLSTQWVAYCLLEKVGKRGFQEEEFGRNVAEEHIIICVDPKPQQLSCLESYLTGPGQVVVLVNPRRIQQQAELLSSLNLILKRYTAALVLRKYTIRGERCLLYNRFPNSWCLFSFQSRQKRLLYKSKNLPADEQSLFASPPPVNNKPIWHWPWDNSSSWWFMKDFTPTTPDKRKTQRQKNSVVENKKLSSVAVAPTSSSPASREVLLQAVEKRLKEQQLRGTPSGGKSRTLRNTNSLRDSDGPDIKDWLN